MLIILMVSLFLRLNRLDYPVSDTFAWGDGTRDYLVASHIVKYGEIPLQGPYNLLNASGVKNSPLYFYALALPLIIFNNPLTLSVVNIFLQMASLVLIYLIAKTAFNEKIAMVALILFSFNPEVIKQADYIWQPYLMLPLALLGLYFLTSAYFEKNYVKLVLSLVAVSLAFVMHNSAFPFWLILMTACFLILKKEKRSLQHYIGLILVVALTVTISYLPLISLDAVGAFPSQTISGYLHNVNTNLDAFLKVFYINKLFLIVFFIVATAILLHTRLYKLQIIFMIFLFLLPIILASFFNKIRIHYLLLSLPSFAILTAGLVGSISSRPLKFLLVFFLAVIFSGNLQFIKELKTPLENKHLVDEITTTLYRDLNQIKMESHFSGFDFFQVKSYALDSNVFDYKVLDTIFIVPLEEKLKTKLAVVSENNYNHLQINQKKYLVLACFRFDYPSSDCRDLFLDKNQTYEVIKTSFRSQYISIFIARQKAIAKLKNN